jgi:hypothetical protein
MSDHAERHNYTDAVICQIYVQFSTISWGHSYEVYQKVPGLGQKRNADLLNFGRHLLQNSLLETIYSDPIVFFHTSNAPWKLFSLMLSSATCDSLWMSDTVSKCRPFSFIFNLGNKAKSQGLSLVSREDV